METLFAQATTAPPPTSPQFGALHILNVVVGLGQIICWIFVLVKMFQNGQTALGVVSICCGIVAFVVGWMNADAWGIKNVMLIWTVLLVLASSWG